ncbi:hypothetical protein ACVIGB_001110 [Bradyrhizobium sp. USDA 4341]
MTTNDIKLAKSDLPREDLSRRLVVPGKIGVAGRAPRAAHQVAAAVGLPHKNAWISTFAADGVLKGGKLRLETHVISALTGVSRPRSADADIITVWPLTSSAAVSEVLTELLHSGLDAGKATDVRKFASKVAASPDGFVLAGRGHGKRNATALLSLFREVEVDHQGRLSYHVHIEELFDVSGGKVTAALSAVFGVQAEADLATLAHAAKAAGSHGSIPILCESNNVDTHEWCEPLGEVIEAASERVARTKAFRDAIGGEVEFEIPNVACYLVS